MHMGLRVPVQSGYYAGISVCAIIVHDQMQFQTSESLANYIFEELDKFLMSMALHFIYSDNYLYTLQISVFSKNKHADSIH